jgi:chain length determinant protein (polysaccharide antigen chain regulator)
MRHVEEDEDELDLLKLWSILLKGKWLIAGVTLACVLAGVGYILLVKPVYEVETYFLPPTDQDIEELSVESVKGSRYDTEKIYNFFLQNLQSRDFRKNFFKEENLMEFFTEGSISANSNRIFEKKFNQMLDLEKIEDNRSSKTDFYLLYFRNNDPHQAVQWVNDFVAQVMEKTKYQLIGDVRAMKQNRIDDLKKFIVSKRNKGERKREDQLIRLKEALELARKLGIDDDKFSGSAMEPAAIYNIGVSYLRGVRALEAQITALKNRKSNDPYIEGLRELQEQLDFLTSIEIDPEKIKVARIDQPAFASNIPIKPKKNVVFALSGFGGIFIGICLVFFLNFLKNAKHEEQNKAA